MKPIHKQLFEKSELINKTIDSVIYLHSENMLFLFFKDLTFCSISYDGHDEPLSFERVFISQEKFSTNIDDCNSGRLHDFLKLGIISEEEFNELHPLKSEIDKELVKQRELKLLQELKQKYEPAS